MKKQNNGYNDSTEDVVVEKNNKKKNRKNRHELRRSLRQIRSVEDAEELEKELNGEVDFLDEDDNEE